MEEAIRSARICHNDATSSSTEDHKAEKQQVSLASLQPTSLTRQTSLDWEFKKTPEGGGPVFFFKMKEKVITSFKASLLLEKNPDINSLPPLPYDLNEDISCSFDGLLISWSRSINKMALLLSFSVAYRSQIQHLKTKKNINISVEYMKKKSVFQ